MTNPESEVIGGVDTHKHAHHAAVIDGNGRLLGGREFPSDATGQADLLAWMRSHGAVRSIGIEGTGFYGASLARFLVGEGQRVVEVNRPNHSARRADGKVRPPGCRAGGSSRLGQDSYKHPEGEVRLRRGHPDSPGNSCGCREVPHTSLSHPSWSGDWRSLAASGRAREAQQADTREPMSAPAA